jgi:hypothetical protein
LCDDARRRRKQRNHENARDLEMISHIAEPFVGGAHSRTGRYWSFRPALKLGAAQPAQERLTISVIMSSPARSL